MKVLSLSIITAVVIIGCDGSPLAPTPPEPVAEVRAIATEPAAPEPVAPAAPAPEKFVSCQDATVRIFNGPDPDKAYAHVSVPAGKSQGPLRFELRAFPVPLTNLNDVDSSGVWEVPPGETEDFRCDRPSRHQAQRVEVRCNGIVVASQG